MMIKTLLLLNQNKISVRGYDMTLALMVHHSLKLLSHQHGRSLTLKMLLQAPPNNNSILILSNQLKTYQCQKLPIYLTQGTLTLPIFQRLSKGQNGQCFSFHISSSGRELFTCKDWGYADVYALMEECHKMLTDHVDWANPEGDQVRIDVSKPLPLSGPPGHVTIQTQLFFNHDLDYLRCGSKGIGQALWISKMKVAYYHDFGLELLKFYIDRHIADSSRKIVITHMRILSVARIKSFSRYEYDYLKEITLRRADYQEYTIAKKDFKSLYPSDFEDLNLLLLQGHLNHLSGSNKRMLSIAVKLWTRNLVIRQWVEDFQLGIESYQKQLNLTKPGWDAKGFEFKHDYTIIESPSAVVFPVGNNERKITRFNEIYMFSDCMLKNIIEALDYRVNEYKVNRLNPGMNTRFWTNKDVERSKEFIHAIERRLKTRRSFRNLECFVGGRVRDIDYRLLQRT
uniref:Uncharacterized protein n=1 Tax=Tanacetum cinerariifolium TaxID=118510 RepID=A0A6L2NUL9_TANCI|nr:hypothetical protein [Tanacetum cinerariifolium]